MLPAEWSRHQEAWNEIPPLPPPPAGCVTPGNGQHLFARSWVSSSVNGVTIPDLCTYCVMTSASLRFGTLESTFFISRMLAPPSARRLVLSPYSGPPALLSAVSSSLLQAHQAWGCCLTQCGKWNRTALSPAMACISCPGGRHHISPNVLT